MEGYGIIITLISIVIIFFFIQGEKKKKLQQDLKIKEFSDSFVSIGESYIANGLPEIDSDIRLEKNEKLHVILREVKWMEFRKVTTGYTTTGASARIRIAKGLSIRTGSSEVTRESMDQLKEIDLGDLYATNMGIIFRGRVGNKNLEFNKVLPLKPTPSGFIIEKDSGKNIYIPYDFQKYPELISAIVVAWDASGKLLF